MSIVAGFDRAAGSYDAAAAIQKEIAATLLADVTLAAPRRILDLGCGTGLLTEMAAQRWPEAKITALDAAPSMLETARRKLPQVHFVEGDAGSAVLPEKFDLVLSSMALHWLSDPAAVLQRWQALLAPGGALHVAVPVAGSLSEWQALCDRFGVAGRLWPFPARESLGPSQLRRHTALHDSAREFLLSMKRTGASHPALASHTTPIASMRAMLRTAPKPFPVSFDIAYIART